MSNDKKYKLLDTVKTITEWVEMFPYLRGRDFTNPIYQFEEVVEQPKGSVKDIDFIQEDNHGYFYYRIKVDKYLNHTQDLPAIKEAIEAILNNDDVRREEIKNKYAAIDMEEQKPVDWNEHAKNVYQTKPMAEKELIAPPQRLIINGIEYLQNKK